MMEGKEMERLRATLNEQLRQTRDRVKLELLEQKEALKQSEKSREDAGVRLHAAQSQLTALQTDLRSVDERYETVSEKREISQKKLAEIKAKHAARLDEAESLHKEATDRREELEALREKIRLTKQYNEEIKSEVAATRTMASKTKDDVKSRAKVKLEQDLYIDNLTRQATRLEDEIAATESQLAAQKEQSADADEMIRETSAAIDKLASEQKRLVQQWKSSVVALGRRDQALAVATKALKKIKDSNRELDHEDARLERDVESLRESNKQMELVRNRLDSEIVYTETTIGRVNDNIEVLSERFEALQESLKASVEEEKSLSLSITKIENEITALNNKGELLIRERHVLEAKISSMRHEQASMSKVAQTLAREEKAVLAKIHDTEIEKATIQNEMARLELDQLNVTQHNISLQQKRKEELAALSDVELKIEAQEAAISRTNDEIDKKTAKIAKLNRQYNTMVEGYEGEEPVGPLEATVKSLARDIEKESAEIRGLQKEWLLRQTELIKTISETNALQEKDGESSTRLKVLRHKSLRLIQEIHTNETSLKSILYKTKGLHTDMTLLNNLVQQNTRKRSEITSKMALDTLEFERSTKDLEQESLRIESQIADVRESHAKVEDDIRDTEAQIKALEYKISVQKQTQKELVSGKDAIEAKGMEKEIALMKKRLRTLVASQERLLRDMEMAIHKREDIAVKGRSTRRGGPGMTKGELDKRLHETSRRAQSLDSDVQSATEALEKTREEHNALSSALEEATAEYDTSKSALDALSNDVSAKEFALIRLRRTADLQNELLKRYQALEDGNVEPVKLSARQSFEIEKKLLRSKEKIESISVVIDGLALKFPHQEDVWDSLNALLLLENGDLDNGQENGNQDQLD